MKWSTASSSPPRPAAERAQYAGKLHRASHVIFLRRALLHNITFTLFLLLCALFILKTGGFTARMNSDTHYLGTRRTSVLHIVSPPAQVLTHRHRLSYSNPAASSKQDMQAVYYDHNIDRNEAEFPKQSLASTSGSAEIVPHAESAPLGNYAESDGLVISFMNAKAAGYGDNMLHAASVKKDIAGDESHLHPPAKQAPRSSSDPEKEAGTFDRPDTKESLSSAIAIDHKELVGPMLNEERLGSPESMLANDFPSKEDFQGYSKPSPMSAPFWLAPKISDWDQQRQAWLAQNPQTRNNTQPNILLVSSSRPKACDNPHGDHSLLKFMKNKMDYCRLHDIEIYYNMVQMDTEMVDYWSKLPLLRTLMISHPEIEWLWWMDSDAMFTDLTFELPMARYKDYNLVIHGWEHQVYITKSWIGLNAGIFLLRNCQWSLDIIDSWASMGANGKIREEAGKILSETLSDRPLYEADDQSVLVYLLNTQKETWGSKVFLESSYCLHGYWDVLVDKYEVLMESSRPGFGDDRWPFITHFVGCKPCAKEGNYAQDRCLEQMERAFNFADNQVLQQYGFKHVSLGSSTVEKMEINRNHLQY